MESFPVLWAPVLVGVQVEKMFVPRYGFLFVGRGLFSLRRLSRVCKRFGQCMLHPTRSGSYKMAYFRWWQRTTWEKGVCRTCTLFRCDIFIKPNAIEQEEGVLWALECGKLKVRNNVCYTHTQKKSTKTVTFQWKCPEVVFFFFGWFEEGEVRGII